ncbi:MAG: stage II sporulation protein M [Acidimicrobiales bacterium]
MDIDHFLDANQPTWERLAALCARADRGLRRLSAEDVDELVRLYQRTSAHLSYARTYYGDPALIARLTALVGRGNVIVYGNRSRSLRSFSQFFTETFPAAVWDARWFVLVSAALFFVPAAAMGVWIAHSRRAVEATGSPALRQAYLSHDFAAYYRSRPSAEFAAQVQTNNIRVAFQAFAGGIVGCVLTIVVLAQNGIGVGQAAGLFASAGRQREFYGLILPHGLLEISSIIVAGAAGLRLGWSLIAPGDLPRAEALAREGRRSVAIVAGLIVTFIVAGTIEGFVTGSALPTTARIGIGILAESTFVLYVVVLGRAGAARGLSGVFGESPTEDHRRPSALSPR